MLQMSSKFKPAGLGQSRDVYTLVEQEIPCPVEAEDILSVIKTVLDFGYVQKVSIESGKPIYFSRYVRGDRVAEEDLPLEGSILAAAVRGSSNMIEVPPGPPEVTLLKMLASLIGMGNRPAFFLARSRGALKSWIGGNLRVDEEAPYGIKVVEHEGVEEGMVALCGVPVFTRRPSYNDVGAVAITHIDVGVYKAEEVDGGPALKAFTVPEPEEG